MKIAVSLYDDKLVEPCEEHLKSYLEYNFDDFVKYVVSYFLPGSKILPYFQRFLEGKSEFGSLAVARKGFSAFLRTLSKSPVPAHLKRCAELFTKGEHIYSEMTSSIIFDILRNDRNKLSKFRDAIVQFLVSEVGASRGQAYQFVTALLNSELGIRLPGATFLTEEEQKVLESYRTPGAGLTALSVLSFLGFLATGNPLLLGLFQAVSSEEFVNYFKKRQEKMREFNKQLVDYSSRLDAFRQFVDSELRKQLPRIIDQGKIYEHISPQERVVLQQIISKLQKLYNQELANVRKTLISLEQEARSNQLDVKDFEKKLDAAVNSASTMLSSVESIVEKEWDSLVSLTARAIAVGAILLSIRSVMDVKAKEYANKDFAPPEKFWENAPEECVQFRQSKWYNLLTSLPTKLPDVARGKGLKKWLGAGFALQKLALISLAEAIAFENVAKKYEKYPQFSDLVAKLRDLASESRGLAMNAAGLIDTQSLLFDKVYAREVLAYLDNKLYLYEKRQEQFKGRIADLKKEQKEIEKRMRELEKEINSLAGREGAGRGPIKQDLELKQLQYQRLQERYQSVMEEIGYMETMLNFMVQQQKKLKALLPIVRKVVSRSKSNAYLFFIELIHLAAGPEDWKMEWERGVNDLVSKIFDVLNRVKEAMQDCESVFRFFDREVMSNLKSVYSSLLQKLGISVGNTGYLFEGVLRKTRSDINVMVEQLIFDIQKNVQEIAEKIDEKNRLSSFTHTEGISQLYQEVEKQVDATLKDLSKIAERFESVSWVNIVDWVREHNFEGYELEETAQQAINDLNNFIGSLAHISEYCLILCKVGKHFELDKIEDSPEEVIGFIQDVSKAVDLVYRIRESIDAYKEKLSTFNG